MAVVSILLLALFMAVPVFTRIHKSEVLAQADLGDGRILRIERVSFGKRHEIGYESPITRYFGPWLPSTISQSLRSPIPRNELKLDRDALVVWVNAVSSTGGTNVDCQGLGVDFVDEHGDVFAEDNPSWFGNVDFWREAHAFYSFPRSTKTLTLRARPWQGTNYVQISIPNPGYTEPEAWMGGELPQQISQGEYTVALTALTLATNKAEGLRSTAVYWNPEFELALKGIKQTDGWNLEWTAEDRYGNEGQELGLSEPALKFIATFHPEATNRIAPVVLGSLPAVTLTNLTSISGNLRFTNGSCTISVIAILPAGVYTFSGTGEYLTNPPTSFTAVGGGAKSGWMSQSRRVTPTRVATYFGHYTDVPVVYLNVSDPAYKDQIGLRLKDNLNTIYSAEREPQGTSTPVVPFVLRVPANVTSFVPELVLLPPVKAEFRVKTTAPQK